MKFRYGDLNGQKTPYNFFNFVPSPKGVLRYMTNDEIREKAEKLIAHSKHYETMLFMHGLPLDSDIHVDQKDQSPEVPGKCSRCNKPVRSTKMKQLVLELTKDWIIQKRPVLFALIVWSQPSV